MIKIFTLVFLVKPKFYWWAISRSRYFFIIPINRDVMTKMVGYILIMAFFCWILPLVPLVLILLLKLFNLSPEVMTGLALLAASPGAPLTTKRSQKAELEIGNYHRARYSTLNTLILGGWGVKPTPNNQRKKRLPFSVMTWYGKWSMIWALTWRGTAYPKKNFSFRPTE